MIQTKYETNSNLYYAMEDYQFFQNAFSLESIHNVNGVVVPSHFSITHGLALYFSYPITKTVTSPVFNYFSNGKLKLVDR